MDKKDLRRTMKQLNRAVDPQKRGCAEAAIFHEVEQLDAFRGARCVAFFAALPDEVSTSETLRRWALEKRVVIPRVAGDEMDFYEYAPEKMVEGAFGIMEPAADATLCAPDEIDLIVVPGVAFTAQGARMGRGRGYYDKYLARRGFRGVKVGVCYRHQIVADLPLEPHDIVMDRVVSA